MPPPRSALPSVRSVRLRRSLAVLALLALLAVACGDAAVLDRPDATTAAGASPAGDGSAGDGATGAGVGADADGRATASPSPADADAVGDPAPTGRRMVVRVLGERPHDAESFTQGLELDGERMYESRGLYGESAVTEVDPATGEVLRRTDLAPTFFGEGLTVSDGRVIQITWRERTAFVYDPDTLAVTGTFPYDGEGWGICDADGVLYMSNGTATLTHRDPTTFLPERTVTVTLDGDPVQRLNELECAGGVVWANVWETSTIVAIDPATGEVVGTVDASPIANPDGRLREDPGGAGAVLNGIAWDALNGVWLLTGKLWPVVYEVALDCVEGCVEDVASALPYRERPGRSLPRPPGAATSPASP